MVDFSKIGKRAEFGTQSMVTVLIEVVLAVALIPVIKTFIASATNLTPTESTLLTLVTLFIVIALVYAVIKRTGLIKG